MKILEITRPEDRTEAGFFLYKYGWKEIGHGAFGNVFGNPKYFYVLKLFTSKDHAYLSYLSLISKFINPHFPKLIGKPVKINDTYYAIRMEKLNPSTDPTLVMVMDDYLEHIRGKKLKTMSDWTSPETIRRREEIVKTFHSKYPSLAKALNLIAKYVITGTSTFNDLAEKNVLQRNDGTLVITDPVA